MRHTILLVTLLLTSGCATFMDQGRQKGFPVTSTPPGAAVTVNGFEYGTTPTTVISTGSRDLHITVTRPLCPAFTAVVPSGLNPWVFGNVLIGGVIGLFIDASSGAMYQYTPDHISVLYETSPTTCAIAGSNLMTAGSSRTSSHFPDASWSR